MQFCSGLVDGGWLDEGVMIIHSFHPLAQDFFSEEEATQTLHTPISGFAPWGSSIYSLLHGPRLDPVSLTLPGRDPEVGGGHSRKRLPALGEGEGRAEGTRTAGSTRGASGGRAAAPTHAPPHCGGAPASPQHSGHSTSPRPFAPL